MASGGGIIELPRPYENPAITVLFRGLVALYKDSAGGISVGIHNDADDHNLVVTIDVQEPNGPISSGTLPVDVKHGSILLQVDGTRNMPLTYNGVGLADANFAYVINLDGPDYHASPLDVYSPNKLTHMRIDGAIYYTADNYPARVGQLTRQLNCKPIAFQVGADVFLQPSSNASLTYYKLDADATQLDSIETYNFKNDGTKYTLHFSNVHPGNELGVGHFRHWYEIFSDSIDPTIEFDVEAAFNLCSIPLVNRRRNPRDNHDNPCNPIYLYQTQISGNYSRV